MSLCLKKDRSTKAQNYVLMFFCLRKTVLLLFPSHSVIQPSHSIIDKDADDQKINNGGYPIPNSSISSKNIIHVIKIIRKIGGFN